MRTSHLSFPQKVSSHSAEHLSLPTYHQSGVNASLKVVRVVNQGRFDVVSWAGWCSMEQNQSILFLFISLILKSWSTMELCDNRKSPKEVKRRQGSLPATANERSSSNTLPGICPSTSSFLIGAYTKPFQQHAMMALDVMHYHSVHIVFNTLGGQRVRSACCLLAVHLMLEVWASMVSPHKSNSPFTFLKYSIQTISLLLLPRHQNFCIACEKKRGIPRRMQFLAQPQLEISIWKATSKA